MTNTDEDTLHYQNALQGTIENFSTYNWRAHGQRYNSASQVRDVETNRAHLVSHSSIYSRGGLL